MKIYIDILLVTNAIMTLIMLEAAGRICHKVISPLRLLTACSVGGLSSLVMAIDSRGYFTAVLIVVIKLVTASYIPLTAHLNQCRALRCLKDDIGICLCAVMKIIL